MPKFTPPTIPGLKIKYEEIKEGGKPLLQSYTAYVGKGYRVFDVSREFLTQKNPMWSAVIRIPIDKESSTSQEVFGMKELDPLAFYALADMAVRHTLPLFVKYKNVTKTQADAIASAVAAKKAALKSASPKSAKKAAKKATKKPVKKAAKKPVKKSAKKTQRK